MLPRSELRLYLGVACAITLSHSPLTSLTFEVGAIGEAFHLSASKTGLLATVELSAYTLANVIISLFINRLPIRLFALMAAFAAVGASLLTAFTENLAIFTLARGIAGLSFGCILGAASAAGSAALVPERAYSVGMGVSIVFGILIPQILAHSMNLDHIGPVPLLPHAGVFLGVTSLTVILAPTMWLLPTRIGQKHASAPNSRKSGAPPLGSSALALAVMILFSIAVYTIYTFLERKSKSIGMSAVDIGNLISGIVAFGMLGTLVSTWLGRRLGLTIPLLCGLAFEALSCLGTATASSRAELWPAALLYMGVWYFVFPYVMALGATLDRTGRLPTAIGAAYLLGSTIAAPFAGSLVDAGSYGAMGIAAFMCCGASIVFTLILSRRVQSGAVLTSRVSVPGGS